MRPVFELNQSAHEVDELWPLAKLGWAHTFMDKRSRAEAKYNSDAQLQRSLAKHDR